MVLKICFYIFLVTACYGVTNQNRRGYLNNGNAHFTSARTKRAFYGVSLRLVKKGSEAVRTLVEGAKKLPSFNEVKQYQKKGSYRQALKDFYALKPYGVQTFEIPGGVYGRVGQVGDRSLVVKSSDDVGNPIVEILKVKGVTIAEGKMQTARELTERISYVSKP